MRLRNYGAKKTVPEGFRSFRAVQGKQDEKPEYAAENRFQTSFVFIVRENSFRQIKYGEETGFGSWKTFKCLTVLYVNPQIMMTN